jgi:glutaredoxin
MEARRCNIHGLVAAEDGRCVICRRGDGEVEGPPPPVVSTGTIVAAVGTLVVAGLVYRGLTRVDTKPAPDPAATIIQPTGTPPAPQPTVDANAQGPVGGSITRASPILSASPPAPIASFVVETTPKEDPKLTQAKHQVAIKMYVTPWCDYCRFARIWLGKQGYRYTEYDVTQSETDKVELRSLNPEETTPTFNVGGLAVVGFDPDLLDQAITRVAMARMSRR